MHPTTLVFFFAFLGGMVASGSCKEMPPRIQKISNCLHAHNIDINSVLSEVSTCLKSFIGDEALQNFTSQSIQSLVKKICSIDHPLECIVQAKSRLEECLDSTFIEMVNGVITMLTANVNFICRADGEKLIAIFRDSDVPECVEKIAKYTSGCSSFNRSLLIDDVEKGQVFTESNCRMADDTSRCFANKLAAHCNKEVGDYVGALHHVMLASGPCKDYVSSSQAILPHLLLLLMTMVFGLTSHWHLLY